MVGRRTIGGTCSRAITKDWWRLIVRSIVGNRATSRGDQQLIVRSIVATYDRSYDRSWRPTTDRTIDRGDLRPIVRSIVATYDRSYDRSWRPTTDRTIDRGDLRPIVRSIVATYDRSYDRSWRPTIDRTIDRGDLRPIVRSIVRLIDPRSCTTGGATIHDWWYDHVRPLCDLLRFGIAGQKFWTWPSTLLRLILLWRSPTTSATSRTFSLRFTHDSRW